MSVTLEQCQCSEPWFDPELGDHLMGCVVAYGAMTESGVFTVEMSCDYYEPMSVKSAWSDESLALNHAEELATEHAEWFTMIVVRKWDLGQSESIKVIYGR